MALVKPDQIGAQLNGIGSLPIVKQLGLMIGFAAAIALAVSIVLWVKEPSYRMLFGNLPDQEMLEVTTALDQAGIPYKINAGNASILVDGGRVHEARMRLAGLGLPKGSGTGYELLDKEQGFGTSQFIETARYQRAIEGELSRTISSLNSVQSARVHLAIPKQSAFVRNRKRPSASVMLNLYQGRNLSSEQAASIANLVASSVPNLELEDVTVVDQSGRMLTRPGGDTDTAYSSTQFEYRKNLEEYYIKRIEEIVEPIVGIGKVRAQVVADLDFSITEQTQESFNPDLPSIRSEQTFEEENSTAIKGGVPGTLSNQPPGAGVLADQASGGAANGGANNNSRRIVRNYELDRTVSHTKHQSGKIKRLSAAVVIDEKAVEGGGTQPLTDEEMARINSLVKEAIGFNVARGDSVNVQNAPFRLAVAEEPIPETPLLEQPWLWDVVKQAIGLVVVLFLIFGVLKPVLKSLAARGEETKAAAVAAQLTGPGGEMMAMPGQQQFASLAAPSYEKTLEAAKSLAQQQPQRVAQVVKEWMEQDG